MDVAVHRAVGNSGYLGLLVGLGWFCLGKWWAQREGGSDDSSYIVHCSSKVESLHLFSSFAIAASRRRRQRCFGIIVVLSGGKFE